MCERGFESWFDEVDVAELAATSLPFLLVEMPFRSSKLRYFWVTKSVFIVRPNVTKEVDHDRDAVWARIPEWQATDRTNMLFKLGGHAAVIGGMA